MPLSKMVTEKNVFQGIAREMAADRERMESKTQYINETILTLTEEAKKRQSNLDDKNSLIYHYLEGVILGLDSARRIAGVSTDSHTEGE